MARPLRIEYPGAICPFYSRLIARQNIFSDNRGRGVFPGALSSPVEREKFLLHAFQLKRIASTVGLHYSSISQIADAKANSK